MSKEQYRDMQVAQYENEAGGWSLDSNSTRDKVVGWFDDHNKWEDYEYLFKDISNEQDLIVLDFGCGPGRNLVKYANRFKRLDGVDLSKTTLEKAKQYIESQNLVPGRLIHCNGLDLANIEDNTYDLIISTITMQHICVHEIRYHYFEEFLRVLKPGGRISIQMGCGENRIATLKSGYYANKYDAPYTNGGCDTLVEDTNYVKKDLEQIGFVDYKCYLRPTGPGDRHENWIYFGGMKP